MALPKLCYTERRLSTSTKVPRPGNAFVTQWVEHFNKRDWKRLRALEHPDFPNNGPPGYNDTFLRSVASLRGKVVSWELKAYQPPQWSILRTQRFYPPPTQWCDLVVEYPDGKIAKMFLALAPAETNNAGFRSCYYVPRERKTRIAPLDTAKEVVRVRNFLKKAIRQFARRKDQKPVQLLCLHYSPDQGHLQISFDVDSSEPGRAEAMSHYAFDELMVPQWADVAENERKEGSISKRLGKMLVKALQSMREQGSFEVLSPTSTSEMGVEEIEGRFGWPAYEERGKLNLLARSIGRAGGRNRFKANHGY